MSVKPSPSLSKNPRPFMYIYKTFEFGPILEIYKLR